MDFENFLCQKGDEIDNAAYALAIALLRTDNETPDKEILPWDINIIRSIVVVAEAILQKNGKESCNPCYIDEIMCSKIKRCKKHPCPFENAQNYDEHNERSSKSE